ncbi:hypothetical protein [Thalassospira xiamenensis]|uniref:hypothetical protein n=1 Tax=Thalassospira xiamenensis TaxID=220697 RepID=UPI0024201E09|nr:hypothetical protein [Thalassospira xiamenensis]
MQLEEKLARQMRQKHNTKSLRTRLGASPKLVFACIFLMFGLIAMLAMLGIQIQDMCTPIPLDFPVCRQLNNLEWETLATGLLSLMAGFIVVFSGAYQVRATRETAAAALRQARMHRADELNAPLQLALDAVDNFCGWSEQTLQHLHELQSSVKAGLLQEEKLNRALDRARSAFETRINHIESICIEHKTTALSYETYSRLQNLIVLRIADTNDPGGEPSGAQYIRYRRYRTLIRDGGTRAAGARTEIERQISENLLRCGIED